MSRPGQRVPAYSDTGLQLLGGSPPIYSLEWDASMVDDMMPLGTTAPVNGATFLGAVSEASDWTLGWTYGIHPDNRAQPLWFE